jgi:hypothetical protein
MQCNRYLALPSADPDASSMIEALKIACVTWMRRASISLVDLQMQL